MVRSQSSHLRQQSKMTVKPGKSLIPKAFGTNCGCIYCLLHRDAANNFIAYEVKIQRSGYVRWPDISPFFTHDIVVGVGLFCIAPDVPFRSAGFAVAAVALGQADVALETLTQEVCRLCTFLFYDGLYICPFHNQSIFLPVKHFTSQ